MYRTQCVLPLVALYLGFVHSWDFAVSLGQQIELYTSKIKTDTVSFNSHSPAALAYDEVHNMILYVDKQLNNDSICGQDLSSKENTCFIERNGRNIHGISFDPATLLIYFTDVNERSVNFISLKGGGNKYGNLLIKNDHGIPTDIVVESCRGYIYWINTNLDTPTIERATLDGLERKVIINSKSIVVNTTYKMEPHSLTIDQKTQKIYWIDPDSKDYYRIFYADLNGDNKTHLIYLHASRMKFFFPPSNTLAVSKTALFFSDWRYDDEKKVFKLGKIKWTGPHLALQTKNVISGIVANYSIKEQILNINDCSALTYIHINERKKICDGTFCVRGTKFFGQAFCKCPPGYTGERCEVSACEKYCFRGSCSVNDEGLPKCRCDAGYSGERCEINLCHGYCHNNGDCRLNDKSEPVCKCKGGYTGDRCESSSCLNYCFIGNCSVNDDGLPQCGCDAGYSGDRCEVNDCNGYCLNDGICSLNEANEATCECVGSFEGSRCEAGQTITLTLPSTSSYSVETNRTLADLLSNWRKPKALVAVIVDEL